MDKVCPVVIRPDKQILVFRHPLAGLQLVKGGVEIGENPAKAAERELFEEAGLTLHTMRDLGQSQQIVTGDIWHFWLMEAGPLPDTWQHATHDDGGHVFDFFWHNLHDVGRFAAPYRLALAHIAQAIP